MPEWIHDLSCWLFHQGHSADWWLVIIAALGGLLAWQQLGALVDQNRQSREASDKELAELRRQIDADSDANKAQLDAVREQINAARESSEKQLAEMEEARKLSIRPLMFVAKVGYEVFGSTDGHQWEVDFHPFVMNAGVGAATNVVLLGWFREVSEEELNDPVTGEEATKRVRESVDRRQPEFYSKTTVVPAGIEPKAMPLKTLIPRIWVSNEVKGYFLYFFKCEDLYGVERFDPPGDDLALALVG